ncbi:MAG: hypothetical protein K0R71_1885 [Bacillales bacterium]|jgi:cold shock CspA family protein|nr:hypothetical protein [Bacillales bacterium]
MEKNLYFEQQGDLRFAVFKLDNEDTIDAFSLEMIRRNKVTGLLGCSTSQFNNEKAIKYNVEKMTPFSVILKKPISENRLIDILLNIVQTLNCLDNYMLLQNHLILDTSFIFVDLEQGKTKLIYLPVESIKNESINFSRFMKEILLDLKLENQSENNFSYKMYSYLHENWNASIKTIGKFLNELKNKQYVLLEDKCSETNVYSDYNIQRDSPQNNSPNFMPNVLDQSEELFAPVQSLKNQINNPISQNKKVKKSSFFSFLNKKETVSNEKEISSFHSVLNQSILSKQNIPHSILKNTEAHSLNTSLSTLQNKGTTVLNFESVPCTTVLNKDSHPYLLRKKTGERFYIKNEIYKIGSDKTKTDIFISNNSTISRNHAIFTKKKGVVFIQDNNSTNGTYVNSYKISKGSTKKLTQGDRITIANEDFEFKNY